MAMEHYSRHEPLRREVRSLRVELDQGLDGVDLKTTEKRIDRVVALMDRLMKKHELSGPVYEDLIHLKSMYSRYQNYAHWLRRNAR
jgi:MoxR-like ATPase